MANIICLWQELLCHIHEYCSLDYFMSEGKHSIKHKSLSKHILLHAIAADSTFQIWSQLVYSHDLHQSSSRKQVSVLSSHLGNSFRQKLTTEQTSYKLCTEKAQKAYLHLYYNNKLVFLPKHSENGSAKNVPVQQHNRLSFWSLLALWAQRFDIHHFFHHVKCLLWRMH